MMLLHATRVCTALTLLVSVGFGCGGQAGRKPQGDLSAQAGVGSEPTNDNSLGSDNTEADPDREPDEASEVGRCDRDLDHLMLQVDVQATDWVDCGSTNYAFTARVREALDCLLAAEDSAARMRVNNCDDCARSSTYVKAAAGQLFEVRTFGESADVDSCSALELVEADILRCTDRTERYSCRDATP